MSHETIYRNPFIRASGALKKELGGAFAGHTRDASFATPHTEDIHGQIHDLVSISERPVAVEDRAVPGHWESDLLFGGKNSQIATLVERQSPYLMLAKVSRINTGIAVCWCKLMAYSNKSCWGTCGGASFMGRGPPGTGVHPQSIVDGLFNRERPPEAADRRCGGTRKAIF